VPFFTSKESGSGVGLSLSRQIMQLHGGTLSYHKNNGGGSIFSIELGV
jgi:two-component system, NtrC family, nitrogen regulation sensor histidine kinase NtrY